jgi:hypothetical protein
MAVNYGGVYTSVSQITGPSGFYNIQVHGTQVIPVYVDQEYSGGGWVCVLANRQNTGGMNNLSYYNAVNTANYRSGGSANGSNTVAFPGQKLVNLANYNIWIGTRFWSALSGRVTANTMTIVQFVAGTNGTKLGSTGSHNKRYRWSSTGFSNLYAFQGVSAVSDETGTGSPGMYNYHAVNGYNLTTYDMDQDTYGSNCSNLYNNNPWWYDACWSGNWFAGNGYADAPYWTSSGGDYWQYGAVYIK